MCCEVGTPAPNAGVFKAATANPAATEQVVLPKISTCQLLPSFATTVVTADFYLCWKGGGQLLKSSFRGAMASYFHSVNAEFSCVKQCHEI